MIGALEGEPVKRLPPAGNVKYRPQTDPPTDAPAPITAQQRKESGIDAKPEEKRDRSASAPAKQTPGQ